MSQVVVHVKKVHVDSEIMGEYVSLHGTTIVGASAVETQNGGFDVLLVCTFPGDSP